MRCLLILAVLLAGACDRVFGLDARPLPDGPPLPVDAPPDAHPTFGSLTPVTLECPTGRAPIDLSLDRDERRFIYGCAGTDVDIYEAPVKDELTGKTATAVVVAPGAQGSPEMSPDGLAVYYLVLITGIGEIHLKQRMTIDDPWGAPTTPDVLNTVADDRPGPPDATGEHFVITRSSPPSSMLVEVVRQGTTYVERTTSTTALRVLGSPINPQISADGRTLVFAAMGDGSDLFISERSNPDAAWGTAVPISEVNTSRDETDPWLSADGRRLYFSRDGVLLLGRK